jgi:gamma-glutamyltranspeptidase/glutathione hydrolase
LLPGGFPPLADWAKPSPRLQNPALAHTLKMLSERGARDLYEGGLADAVVADLAAGGSRIEKSDLTDYRASIVEPLAISYARRSLLVPDGLTAGPTLADALARLDGQLGSTVDAAAFIAYAEALAAADRVRLESMGEGGTAAECTTHLSVIDRDGNMVALTQTLLSLFGSKVVLPETGILMNNAINWFDPRPGRRNSLGAGKRPLSNMLPTLGLDADLPWLAIGASGGRRILPALLQLISFQADFGLTLEAAFHQPRIDTSLADEVAVDPLLDAEIKAELARRYTVVEWPRTPYPLRYACPAAVAIEGGERVALTEVSQPWASAAAG